MNSKMAAMTIAVFLVLGIMLYFIVISLRIITENISKKVNSYFLAKLSDYDDEFRVKIKEIERLEDYRQNLRREINSLERDKHSLQVSRFFAPRPVIRDVFIPVARYIDNNFFEDYKKTKRLLQMNKRTIIQNVLDGAAYTGDMDKYRAANSIKEKLNFQAVYDLCTLYQTQQIDFLQENLEGAERELLQEYLGTINMEGPLGERNFDMLHFMRWLEQIINEHSPYLTAYLGEENEDYSDEERFIRCAYDANICEGVKIIYQNMLYNYSVYEARKKNQKIY